MKRFYSFSNTPFSIIFGSSSAPRLWRAEQVYYPKSLIVSRLSKSDSSQIWLEAGYQLLAYEGPDSIQVEKLARKVNRDF